MKAKIIFISIIFPVLGFSQSPINNFFGARGAVYEVVTSSPSIDQTQSGANIVWNFTQLTQVGQSISTNSTPSASELTTFPNTTILNDLQTAINNVYSNSKIFVKNISNEISLTGFRTPDLELNYINNNAKIGTFPLTYGYNFTDTSSGTFVSGSNSGTFTGNIITSVDAYGTLSLNNTGNGPFTGPVTRLKTVQNINLSIGFPVGTVVLTTYAYYNISNGSECPEFRYTSAVVNIPLLNIVNQTVTQLEDFVTLLLSTNKSELSSNNLKIYPIPAKEILNIRNESNQKINAIILSDINGRAIINKNSEFESLNLSEIEKGVYIMKIITNNGNFTQKILKE